MQAAKICMVGDFSVGKTSMVARYVHSTFSDRYLTTVGVKIDTRQVELEGGMAMKLVLWDLAGTDVLNATGSAYLRGAAGYLLVIDGTRRDTLETACRLQEQVSGMLGDTPFVAAVNKADLKAAWEVTPDDISQRIAAGWPVECCSAKTGEGVGAVFQQLANAIAAR